MSRASLRNAFWLFAVLTFSTLVAAEAIPDRFQTNHDIRVEPGQKSGDLACINCSIYIRGEVAGDAFTLNGNVVVEQGAQIAGDVTAVHGDVRLHNGSQIAGDVATIGGTVHRDPQAAVAGDVASLGGAGWTLLIFVVPLAVIGGIIALIVWLVQRSRGPAPVAA